MFRTTRAAVVLLAVAVVATACGKRIPPQTPTPPPAPRVRAASYKVTAYCTGTRTSTGLRVRDGIVAADPAVIPMGSVIRIEGLANRYNGEYEVLDTGPKIRGRTLDLYVPSCAEAVRFGRRSARVTIVRRGDARAR